MKKRKKILRYILIVLILLLIILNVFIYRYITSPRQKADRQLDLGQRYLLNMEYEEAVAAFEIVIEVEPNNVAAYTGMAEAYIGMGELEKAVRILNKGYKQTGDESLKELLDQLEAELNREEADVRIVQIDTGEFPDIAVYFSVEDASGSFIGDVQPDQIQVFEECDGEWIEQTGSFQFSGQQSVERRSVAMVVDVSGSMSDSIGQLCDAACGLLGQMKEGYYVSLTAFDDQWYSLVDYTNNFSLVSNELNSLHVGGGTALYDTLENSLYESVNQQGQKYILAFTDGADGSSSITKDELIALAAYYHIPIYIIAAGNQGYMQQEMEEIATESGGAFYALSSMEDLYAIYLDIFEIQENLYSFRYMTRQSDTECGLRIVYHSSHFDGAAENNFISQKPMRRERVSNRMIAGVRATSQLEDCPVENAFDTSEYTMWSEGVWGGGVGEAIEIALDEMHEVNGLTIYNGNRTSHDLYDKYGRVKTIQVTFSDGSKRQFEVADNFYGPSPVNFINPVRTDLLKIEILEIYAGTTYQDTCITGININ